MCPPFPPQVSSSSDLPRLETLPLLPTSPDPAPSRWYTSCPTMLAGILIQSGSGWSRRGKLPQISRKAWGRQTSEGWFSGWKEHGCVKSLELLRDQWGLRLYPQPEWQMLPCSPALGRMGGSRPGPLYVEHLLGARHRPSELSQPSGGVRYKYFTIMG